MEICCQQETRRDAVRQKDGWNGLDYVEVLDDLLSLELYFLGKLPNELLDNCNEALCRFLKVTGGRQISDIQVIGVEPYPNSEPDKDDYLLVRFNKYGDHSTYTISLVDVEHIDPRYQSVDFSFKVDCPSDMDCVAPYTTEPKQFNEPEINYLAKDYASFRQLILDRLSVLMPDWNERHAPDLMITLIEILAYVGDYLSYYQDAAATEAYLSTARKRISVRRHARLVDYKVHEGCNSRAWMSVEFDSDSSCAPVHSKAFQCSHLVTNLQSQLPSHNPQISWEDMKGHLGDHFQIFEPLPIPWQNPPFPRFNSYRSKIQFYTWGEKNCHLPQGCTSATLVDEYLDKGVCHRALDKLEAGDVLLFEEDIGPETGKHVDANPLRRHAVMLTFVGEQENDDLFQTDGCWPIPIRKIEWAQEDALPFSLRISGITAAPSCMYKEGISIARGNVFLADSGKTIELEYLGEVPTSWTLPQCEDSGLPSEIQNISGRFRPHLSLSPLTFGVPLPEKASELNSASSFLIQDVRDALPHVELFSLPRRLCRHFDLSVLHKFIPTVEEFNGTYLEFKGQLPPCLSECFADDKLPATRWLPRLDLLSSEPDDYHFVVEIDDQGIAQLRFGDGILGAQPETGSVFFAKYRIGNGIRGNAGANSISYRISDGNSQTVDPSVRNPLPATGGTEPEPISEVKLYAPGSFRKIMERAITADDYRLLAQRNKKLQRAAAELVWTGSWYEAEVSVDPLGTNVPPSELLKSVEKDLRQYRRMGHEIRVRAAKYVPIELSLVVNVLPHYQQAHVKAALLDSFSNRNLAGGKRGFFHPDNFSFGDTVEVSSIIAAGMAVNGVEDIAVGKLKRMFEVDSAALEKGFLAMSSQEIAQLDNDLNFPERGKLMMTLSGGR